MSLKQFIERRKAAGLCSNCGSRPPKPDCKWCVPCLMRSGDCQYDLRQYRRSMGLCISCGHKAKIGYTRCRICLKKYREASLKYVRKIRKQ